MDRNIWLPKSLRGKRRRRDHAPSCEWCRVFSCCRPCSESCSSCATETIQRTRCDDTLCHASRRYTHWGSFIWSTQTRSPNDWTPFPRLQHLTHHHGEKPRAPYNIHIHEREKRGAQLHLLLMTHTRLLFISFASMFVNEHDYTPHPHLACPSSASFKVFLASSFFLLATIMLTRPHKRLLFP